MENFFVNYLEDIMKTCTDQESIKIIEKWLRCEKFHGNCINCKNQLCFNNSKLKTDLFQSFLPNYEDEILNS